VWDALNFDAPVADPSSDPTPPPTLPMIEIPDVDGISAIEPRSRQTGDGRLPAPTECETFAKLDRRARLIPHSLDPTLVEHYRRLRTKIIQEREVQDFRSLVVTSALPQEGKSVTVMNLALSFSMLPDFRVLIVDGDMRRGTLGTWLGVENDLPGLSNLIDGSARVDDVIRHADNVPMHFVLSGNSQTADLHSAQLKTHFQEMTARYDLVLVDSPPVNLISDVQLIAGSCDAVLVVARAFTTTRPSLQKALQDLSPFRVLGTVLNAGEEGDSKYYGYY